MKPTTPKRVRRGPSLMRTLGLAIELEARRLDREVAKGSDKVTSVTKNLLGYQAMGSHILATQKA